ncbi:hypothetical protein NQZ68_040187, partial [Dissostichus eleginoides]
MSPEHVFPQSDKESNNVLYMAAVSGGNFKAGRGRRFWFNILINTKPLLPAVKQSHQ